MYWPIEGMPVFLQKTSYFLPFTIPSNSVRDILIKNYGFKNLSSWLGILIPTAWSMISIIVMIVILKYKKFSR